MSGERPGRDAAVQAEPIEISPGELGGIIDDLR